MLPSGRTAARLLQHGGRRGLRRQLSLGGGFDVLGGVKEGTMKLTVDGLEDTGFQIGSISVKSSMLILPHAFFLWKPKTVGEITKESLLLPTIVKPGLELLIIGKGEDNTARLPEGIEAFLREHRIAVEHMSTIHALATYNVLTAEDRNVGAALITPSPVPDDLGAIAASMPEYEPVDEDPLRPVQLPEPTVVPRASR